MEKSNKPNSNLNVRKLLQEKFLTRNRNEDPADKVRETEETQTVLKRKIIEENECFGENPMRREKEEEKEIRPQTKMAPENDEKVNLSEEGKTFYDVVIKCDSIKNLKKKWEINTSVNFEKFKDKEQTIVGVLGGFNRGKSFLLQKISGYNIEHGYSVETEGISVKYPDNMEKAVTLLDSAGSETPLKYVEEDEENKDTKEILKNDEKRITELARDRAHTEIFLQKFILERSHILLVVVGNLTYSDQKLINKLRKLAKKKEIFIIHNLSNFNLKEQVETYVQKTILKSFRLRVKTFTNMDKEVKNGNNNINYLKELNEEVDMTHLIMAKEDSLAGDFYNAAAIDFIKNRINGFTNSEKFDPIISLKKFLFNKSNEIFEEDCRITEDQIVIEDNSFLLKLEKDKEIVLKKVMIDELGFSKYYGNSFTPSYSIIKVADEGKLIVKVDIANVIGDTLEVSFIQVDNYTVFKLSGEKEKDMTNGTYVLDNRDSGKFSIETTIPIQEFTLKNNEPIDFSYKNGTLTFIYEMVVQKKVPFKPKFQQD